MIIKKIEIENFMCYSGQNVMEFTEGINVIIGDNGYGKSKLYDAFYWVMYDQVFVTEKKEFQNTRIVKSYLISDKSKISDGKIFASVCITFHNIERDSIFILERKYKAEIKNGLIIESNDSEFTIMKKDLSYLNAKIVNDEEEKRRILDSILPPQIKDYLWFQGEQVESIIDFNKQDTLTKAINALSGISKYDDLKNLATKIAKNAREEYRREVNRLSLDQDKSEKLESDRIKLEKELKDLVEEENDIKNNLSTAESKTESLLSKLSDATKISELKQLKKSNIDKLEYLNELVFKEQTSYHRKLFRNKWVLKGTNFLHEKFSAKFSNYEKVKLKLVAEANLRDEVDLEINNNLLGRLPIDVPEPIYLQIMLDKERCLVCDRPAIKGTNEYIKIEELLHRPKQAFNRTKTLLSNPQNFLEDLKKIYQNSLSLSHRLSDIEADIADTLENITEINSNIRITNNEIDEIEKKIEKIVNVSSQSLKDPEAIISEFAIQDQYVKEFTAKYNKITQQIEFKKKSIDNNNEDLKKLITGELPIWLSDKHNVLNYFEEIMQSTRDRVFTDLISQLEKGANNHYIAMTSNNRSTRGQMRLRKLPNGNFMPEVINSDGTPLLGSNTSNIILVKLAAIMSIISAKSNDGFVSFYTLITDAPTSVFGEDYTIGFCKTVSKVYRQSIIMSKEFYKNQNLRTELLTNKDIKIGNVYLVTPSISELERDDRKNLSTNIEKLN